jgi:hypothetical protein
MNRPPQNRSACQTSRLHQEVLVGGAVGMVAGALFAHHLGASAGIVVFAAVPGWATGTVVGVLLWVSAASFSAAPIPPVRPSSADSEVPTSGTAHTDRPD